MTRATTQAISPFFIVRTSIKPSHFTATNLASRRDSSSRIETSFSPSSAATGAQIFVKSDKDTSPLPNPKRNPSMGWNAYVYAPDPDALAVEFTDHGATFSVPLKDTHDGLRRFEICDPDGYVLFFGRPTPAAA